MHLKSLYPYNVQLKIYEFTRQCLQVRGRVHAVQDIFSEKKNKIKKSTGKVWPTYGERSIAVCTFSSVLESKSSQSRR